MLRGSLILVAVLSSSRICLADGTIANGTLLAPFAGHLYTRAPGQSSLRFTGTDLGYSVYNGNSLRFFFGDTWVDSSGNPIDPTWGDDSVGEINTTSTAYPGGAGFPNGDAVEAWVNAHVAPTGRPAWWRAGPPLAMKADSTNRNLRLSTLYRGGTGGTRLPMGLGKTPLAVFANGTSSTGSTTFGVWHRVVARQCNSGCATGFTCDSSIGTYFGFDGEDAIPCDLTYGPDVLWGCVPVSGGGYCQDRGSSFYSASTRAGRILSIVLVDEVGNRDSGTNEMNVYTQSWETNRFSNLAIATVQDFSPDRAPGDTHNIFTQANGVTPLTNQKVFLWGRPGFVGVNSEGLSPKLYFAYADMPASFSATGSFKWTVHYFTGFSSTPGCMNGNPTGTYPCFSTSQTAARPVDLQGTGDATNEKYDIVNQMTIAWVPALSRWVMLYGGDQDGGDGGGLDLIVGDPDWQHVVHAPFGNIHSRFASSPWGPWTEGAAALVGGDPNTSPPSSGTQLAANGMLHHPGCTNTNLCAPSEPGVFDVSTSHGHLYAPNIVDKWTTTRGTNQADIYWTVSSWDPMETVLVRSRVSR